MGKIAKRRRAAAGREGRQEDALGRGGFGMHKSKGQHLLKNPLVVNAIVAKAGVKPTDTVLEVGPGTGNLSVKILEAGVKKLVAVELDPRMVVELTKRVQAMDPALSTRLNLHHADVLRMTPLPYFDLCISNTPYQISSPLVFKLLAHRPPFRAALLMFQREFAMRLVAKPGDNLYCRLSVNTQLLSRVSHVMKVDRKNFRPPPKVDSSVVRIEPRHPPPPISLSEWDGLIRLCFLRKHKTLAAIFKTNSVLRMMQQNANTLRALQSNQEPTDFLAADDDAHMTAELQDDDSQHDVDMEHDASDDKVAFKKKIVDLLEQSGYAKARAAKMDMDDFLALLKAFNDAGLHFA